MKAPSLKSDTALFLQAFIVLIGMTILGLMLVEPHFEGRNAHATTFEVYFKDPFLAYAYAGSIPFFIALFRAFGLFGDVRRNGRFSQVSVNALQAITYCGLTIIGFVAGAVVFVIRNGDNDDRPAGVFMCLLVALGATGIAVGAAMFARKLKSALGRGEGVLG